MQNIEQLLPHRPPFVFVDRLAEVTQERVVGYRKFAIERDDFFRGHFPGYPVVPGVLLVESLAQCGGAGVRALGTLAGDTIFFLATIEKAKFRRQVRPGDEIRMVIENLRISPKALKQRGVVYVGEEIAAEAEWLCIGGSASA